MQPIQAANDLIVSIVQLDQQFAEIVTAFAELFCIAGQCGYQRLLVQLFAGLLQGLNTLGKNAEIRLSPVRPVIIPAEEEV